MITPQFKLKQDDLTLTIEISAPYIKGKEIALDLTEGIFTFCVVPYFLRLNFEEFKFKEDEIKAEYEISGGKCVCHLPKFNPGATFDLGIDEKKGIEKLLAIPTSTLPSSLNHLIGLEKSKPGLIEEVEEEDSNDPLANDEEWTSIKQGQDWNWHLPQELPNTTTTLSSMEGGKTGYGFNQGYFDVFNHLEEAKSMGNEVLEVDPNASILERREQRMLKEDDKFDPDHYLADFKDEQIKEICRWEFSKDPLSRPELDEQDWKDWKSLPKKSFLEDQDDRPIYLGLVDLLFAHSYDYRINLGDECVESAWNICINSPSLAGLEVFETLPQVVLTCTRRSLAYPLYRNWELAKKCWKDVEILLSSKQLVLKTLLRMRRILEAHHVYHVYSTIYLTDYCRWIGKRARSVFLLELAKELETISLKKETIEWDLLGWEELWTAADQGQ